MTEGKKLSLKDEMNKAWMSEYVLPENDLLVIKIPACPLPPLEKAPAPKRKHFETCKRCGE
jgi:hypothetical protein